MSSLMSGMTRNGGEPKTVEQLLRSDSPTAWNTSATFGSTHDQEEDHLHHGKKLSVIAKVKEKAKKWRQSIVKKKHGHGHSHGHGHEHDTNHSPSWSFGLEDYEAEEYPETHGRHHPDSLAYEKRVSSRGVNIHSDNLERGIPPSLRKRIISGPSLSKSRSDHHGETSYIPRVTVKETFNRARSFSHQRRGNDPSPGEIIAEALITRRNVDKHKEKLPSYELPPETEPGETNVVDDKEEHPSDINTSSDIVIEEITTSEEEEQPLKHRKSNQERERPLHTPRKSHQESEISHRIPGAADKQRQKKPHSPTKVDQKREKSPHSPTEVDQKREKSPHSPTEVDQKREKSPHIAVMADQETEKSPHTRSKADQESEKLPQSPKLPTEFGGTKLSNATEQQEQHSPTTMKAITEAVSEKLAPAYATVSEATHKITTKIQGLSIPSLQGTAEERKWDKGVSVKEYFKNKLEPGEDERALSQVISEVISPRRSPTEKGVVEKMRTAMSLLLQTEEPSASSSMKTTESPFPVSTNAHEVEEENQGRVLQAN